MSAKEIILRPIAAKDANALVRRVHYSGKVVNNSQIHIGVFYRGALEGAMQFGPSLDKRKIQGLVAGTLWNEFIELNRMAFSDALPRNSESRAIAIAMRLLRKHAPHLKWVVSFADGTQCGDGTIYRASGFVLTGLVESRNLVRRGDGVVIHKMTLESNPTAPRPELGGRSYYGVTGGKYDLAAYARATGGGNGARLPTPLPLLSRRHRARAPSRARPAVLGNRATRGTDVQGGTNRMSTRTKHRQRCARHTSRGRAAQIRPVRSIRRPVERAESS